MNVQNSLFEPNFARDASPKRLLRHGKRLKGIGQDYERAGKNRCCAKGSNVPPGENISAGAGVFAIKNIRIDAGSSSVGQERRPCDLGSSDGSGCCGAVETCCSC